jgi:hypothetical protein
MSLDDPSQCIGELYHGFSVNYPLERSDFREQNSHLHFLFQVLGADGHVSASLWGFHPFFSSDYRSLLIQIAFFGPCFLYWSSIG